MWFYLPTTKDSLVAKIWGKIFSRCKMPWSALTEIATWFVCIEIMWLKLCQNDFLRISDRINRCIESTPIALYGNDRKQLHLFYARHGETLRDLKYSFKDCHGNCMHRRKCVVSKCMENCTISRQEIDEKYLIYSRNYSIPHRNKEKKWIIRSWFSGFNSKNKHDHIINITKVFFYVSAWLMWSPLQDRRCTMFSRLPWKGATKNIWSMFTKLLEKGSLFWNILTLLTDACIIW